MTTLMIRLEVLEIMTTLMIRLEELRGTDGRQATGETGLRNSGTRREKRGRLEDSDSDTVMNDIIGFTPCNFCDYMCMNFKFVGHKDFRTRPRDGTRPCRMCPEMG